MKLLLTLLFLGFCSWTQANSWVPRVVGGQQAEKNQFPHQVGLYKKAKFNCGGSIIRKNWVLTAAHCIVNAKTYEFQVVSGTIIIDRISGGSLHNVEKLIAHEDYGNFMNDVALMKIRGEFLLGESRKIIPLNRDPVPVGADIIVSGWGRIVTNGTLPRILKWNTLVKIDPDVCSNVTEIDRGIICLGHVAGQGVCNGDSGGPALYNDKVVGVANFVIDGCGTDLPDGYAEVAPFVDWIEKNIQDNDNEEMNENNEEMTENNEEIKKTNLGMEITFM